MRICLVSSSFYPSIVYGGPIFSTWDLTRSLAEKGLNIYVSTTNANGKKRLKDVDTASHVKLKDNIFIRYYHEQIINYLSFSFIFNLWNDIKKSELVYIQYIFHYTSVIALFYSFLLRKKVILCARGSLSSWGMSYKKKLIKKIWIFFLVRPFVKNILWQACSHLEASDIKACFEDAYIEIIYDGVDVNEFTLTENISKINLVKKYTDLDFESVSEVIFSMGRLHRIKRFDVLIDAFSIYLKENPDAKLLIAGSDYGIKNDLMNKINNLNLDDSVFLIGFLESYEKKELFNNVDVFALCSDFESFGLVVAEALASGCPVIISDKTHWSDIQINNCGIFAENNAETFSKAFHEVKNMSIDPKVCKNYIRSNFNHDLIANKFLLIINKYRSCIS